MKIINERGLNKREQYYRQRITTFGDHATMTGTLGIGWSRSLRRALKSRSKP